MTIPAHVPATIARDVRLERAFGSSTETIARTIAVTLATLTEPVACLACVSRRRRLLSTPCRVCGPASAPAGWFRWRGPYGAVEPDERAVLAEVASNVRPVPVLGSRSDVAPAVTPSPATPGPGHDDVDDWEYGGWPGIPMVPYVGPLVVGG